MCLCSAVYSTQVSWHSIWQNGSHREQWDSNLLHLNLDHTVSELCFPQSSIVCMIIGMYESLLRWWHGWILTCVLVVMKWQGIAIKFPAGSLAVICNASAIVLNVVIKVKFCWELYVPHRVSQVMGNCVCAPCATCHSPCHLISFPMLQTVEWWVKRHEPIAARSLGHHLLIFLHNAQDRVVRNDHPSQ